MNLFKYAWGIVTSSISDGLCRAGLHHWQQFDERWEGKKRITEYNCRREYCCFGKIVTRHYNYGKVFKKTTKIDPDWDNL